MIKKKSTDDLKTELERDKLSILKDQAALDFLDGKKKDSKGQKQESIKDTVKLCNEERAQRMKRLGSGNVNESLNREKEADRQRIVDKSKRIQLEQEEEIKKLNQVIDQAQCFAVRDKQIQENSKIREYQAEKERFLDRLQFQAAERERVEQEEWEKKELARKSAESAKLMQQIKEKEKEKILEKEARISENLEIKNRLEKEKEMEILRKIEDEQKKILERKELLKINENIKKAKLNQLKSEKDLDERLSKMALEMDKKQEERENNNKAKKEARERIIASLLSNHEKNIEDKAKRDELLMHRAQMKAEQEWRREELENTRKKQEEANKIKEERKNYIEMKEKQRVKEAERQKYELHLLFKEEMKDVQKREILKEAEEMKKIEYRRNLSNQVEQKLAKVMEDLEKNAYKDRKIAEEQQSSKELMESIKIDKIKQLEKLGINSKYLNDVKKKVFNR